MKATGIVRDLDSLGRIVIPQEIRKVQGLKPGTPMEIYTDERGIVIRRHVAGCLICGAADNTVAVEDTRFCRRHAREIGEAGKRA